MEYDEELASEVFKRIPKIANAIKKSNPEIKGINILNNNGEVAFQSVFHSHIHIIPRYSDNDSFGLKWQTHEHSSDELLAIAQSIIKQMEV